MTSKCGDYEDIEHFTLEALAGTLYGDPVTFLARKAADQGLEHESALTHQHSTNPPIH